MPGVETNAKAIRDRLTREGWKNFGGTRHDKFAHLDHPGVRIMVPRDRTLSAGVARSVAKAAGRI